MICQLFKIFKDDLSQHDLKLSPELIFVSRESAQRLLCLNGSYKNSCIILNRITKLDTYVTLVLQVIKRSLLKSYKSKYKKVGVLPIRIV